MAIAKSEFPSSVAFEALASALQDEQVKKELKKQGNGIFQFNLKNAAGDESSWTLDLKNEGKVIAGSHEKPTVTLSLPDELFAKLVDGKVNAQKLYMGGKLKIKGDVMKATKLEPILKKAKTQAKL